METPLLSNGNHVSTLQLHFRAINSINLADPSDKAGKKKQAERNKGENLRPQNRENKPGQGEQPGAVQTCTSTSSLSLHGQALETEQPPGLQRKELPLSLSSSFTAWDTQKAGSAPEPPGAGQGAGGQFGTDHLLCWSFPQVPLSIWQLLFLYLCWICHSAHFFSNLASSCIGLWGMLTSMSDRLPVYTESKLDSKMTLNSPPRQTPTTLGTTASPWRTTEQDFLI